MHKKTIPEEEEKELASAKITCIYCGRHRKKSLCRSDMCCTMQVLPAKMAGGVGIQSSW